MGWEFPGYFLCEWLFWGDSFSEHLEMDPAAAVLEALLRLAPAFRLLEIYILLNSE